ncbi:uncharacterized calcium-binding protein At1g02270 [Selaginella moellendorffii]|uniref:uncharacterized calcium-binding protein At1g02270 n=1 Tax=Selaginella moellendorffii TaxID=88036 RepID=UPI000D1C2B23|nr:uncharacterized calcium-binding protein At1g02270 [Selaginella moellendorffii]|eukprot:XP_024517340.1 uncharacterized calcium-binding protein At1g02270 [Selaginella moellendorffii]
MPVLHDFSSANQSSAARNTMLCQAPWDLASSGDLKRKRSWREAGRAVCFKDEAASSAVNTSFSCTTFNILAPIYKRVNGEECRESQSREVWLDRNRRILDMLLKGKSSAICLQEFWTGNEELVELYEKTLGAAGYDMRKLARPNGRGDGLFTAVKRDVLRVMDYQELQFHDCGDRVAQFLRLQSNIPMYRDCLHVAGQQEVLLVNTHLIFPHNSNFCLVRLRQVYKILKYLEQYKDDHNLSHAPVLLCGDWNGSKRGQVYKFLRLQGFVSSYDVAHQYSDCEADAHRWVSHRNHRGNICGVDFIWLLNPSKSTRSLRENWKSAVFGIIKSKLLREHGKQGRDAFCFFQQNECDECLTYEDFHATLRRLELTKEDLEGLSRDEIEELIKSADFDGNGVIDYDEFQESLAFDNAFDCNNGSSLGSWSKRIFQTEIRKSSWEFAQPEEPDHHPCLVESSPELDVRHASFHPPEVEQGTWPDNYSLSDHAPLTAMFAPVYAQSRLLQQLPANFGFYD